MYDYFENVKADILEAIENGSYSYIIDEYKDEEGEVEKSYIFDELYDDMWTDDSITGNASGSYTFNTYEAEENIAHNLDLLAEACEAFGSSMDVLKDGAEACDVTIRCYLLSSALDEALDEIDYIY